MPDIDFSYKSLWLKTDNSYTGFSVVNQVLCRITNQPQDLLPNNCLLFCPLLNQPVTMKLEEVKSRTLTSLHKEIGELMAVFADLFLENNDFREQVIFHNSHKKEEVFKICDSMLENTVIPISEGELAGLTKRQLLEILIYIDSLRASNGISDTKFANLQNEIVKILANKN